MNIAKITAAGFVVLFLAGPACAQPLTLDSLPPVVVKTTPAAGAVDVDPKTKEIRVTFSKEMKAGSWSAYRIRAESFPKVTGKLKFEKDGKTWVLPVALQPGTTYALWLNQGNRGAFADKSGNRAVPYLLAFRTRGKAPAMQFDRDRAAKSFEKLIAEMSAKYSYFSHKKIDWEAVVKMHRAGILAATNEAQFLKALEKMLAELKDGHVWIKTAHGIIPSYVQRRELRLNQRFVLGSLKKQQRIGRFAYVGLTKQGIPALIVTRQSATTLKDVLAVRDFFEQHRDAPGFVFDLRLANGGNENYAMMIAGMFNAKKVVYAKHRYRNGPKPTDFGEARMRTLPAAAKPIDKPIICLIGPGAVSSGEGWALMMKALPKCRLVGRPTRGSTGNPRPFAIAGTSLTVYFSTWVATNPKGDAIEGRGVFPDIKVEYPAEKFQSADPLWIRGLEELSKLTRK